MKSSKIPQTLSRDKVLTPPRWRCFDGCVACKFLKRAAEEGRKITLEELESVIAEAKRQAAE